MSRSLDLLTPNKPTSDRRAFDRPLELAASRLSFEGPEITSGTGLDEPYYPPFQFETRLLEAFDLSSMSCFQGSGLLYETIGPSFRGVHPSNVT